MTVLEALNIEVGNSTLASKYLALRGLNAADVYSATNHNEVEIAKAYCFKTLAAQPNISEDGLSIQYSRSELIRQANEIFAKNNLESEMIGTSPTVSNGTNLW